MYYGHIAIKFNFKRLLSGALVHFCNGSLPCISYYPYYDYW